MENYKIRLDAVFNVIYNSLLDAQCTPKHFCVTRKYYNLSPNQKKKLTASDFDKIRKDLHKGLLHMDIIALAYMSKKETWVYDFFIVLLLNKLFGKKINYTDKNIADKTFKSAAEMIRFLASYSF